MCHSFLFKLIHTLTTFCFTIFLYCILLTFIFLSFYTLFSHTSCCSAISYSGRVEDLFVRNYRGIAVSSFSVANIGVTHTDVWAEQRILYSSFLKQTLSFHLFFSSELSISSQVWQTSGGQRSLKAGKVDSTVIRKCSHFGTCQSLWCIMSENHPSVYPAALYK